MRSEVLTDGAAMWYLLFPNACLAVGLNITIAQVITETSAVGFMITGMVKDVVLVCFSSAVFHDTIQTQQWCAFKTTHSRAAPLGGGGDGEGGDRNRQKMKGGGRGASAVAS